MPFIQLDEVKRYVIFITGGSVGALVNWVISFVLTSLLGVYYLISFTAAQLVNIAVNFTWHRFVTFKVSSSAVARFARFLVLSILTLLLSLTLVYVLKEHILDPLGELTAFGYELNYLAAIVIVTFVVSVINYLVSKTWVFNTGRGEELILNGETAEECCGDSHQGD
jgi:putative flippase GtrA